MARIKRAVNAQKKRRKMMKLAKGEIKREEMSEQEFIGQMKEIFKDKLSHQQLPAFS